jgi:hypothetical protein
VFLQKHYEQQDDNILLLLYLILLQTSLKNEVTLESDVFHLVCQYYDSLCDSSICIFKKAMVLKTYLAQNVVPLLYI